MKELRRLTLYSKCHAARVKNYAQEFQALTRAEPFLISFKTKLSQILRKLGV